MSGITHLIADLFGPGTWGTGGNIVAAGILTVPAYLLRSPIGRWLAKHIHPHLQQHVHAAVKAAVAEQLPQTPAPATPDAGATAITPAAGPSAAASPPATAAEGAVHHEPEPAPQHTKGIPA